MHPFPLFIYNKPEMASAITTEGGSGHTDSLGNNFYFDQSKFWVKFR